MASHPANAKYPDTVAVTYDETNHKVTCVYSDRSLYLWDVRDIRKVRHCHHKSLPMVFLFLGRKCSFSDIPAAAVVDSAGGKVAFVPVPRGLHLGCGVVSVAQGRNERCPSHRLFYHLLERRHYSVVEPGPQHGHQHDLPEEHLQQRKSFEYFRLL